MAVLSRGSLQSVMACWNLLIICSFVCMAPVVVTEQVYWQRHQGHDVISYQAMTSAGSSLLCVRECLKHSQCDSFAYEKELGTCYLQVTTDDAHNDTANSIEVYKAPSCRESEAPINYATTSVTWQRTGMELEGQQICNDDSMFIGNSPTIRCSGNGRWSSDGECRQKVWRNVQTAPQVPLPVPQAPVQGWTVCVNGTPTARDRFSVDLRKDSKNVPFHLDTRLNKTFDTNPPLTYVDMFGMASRISGTWTNFKDANNIRPFPIAVNEPFEMKIKAKTLFDVEVYVNNTLYATHTLTVGLNEVTRVSAYGFVKVGVIDLWCDQ